MEPIEERSDEWDDDYEVTEAVYEALETIGKLHRNLSDAAERALNFQEAIKASLGDVTADADYLRELLPKLAEHRAEMETKGWPLERLEELVTFLATELPTDEELIDDIQVSALHMVAGVVDNEMDFAEERAEAAAAAD